MAVEQVIVPYIPGHDYGVGANLSTGSPLGKVVQGAVTGIPNATGSKVDFQVRRIYTTRDLEMSLGIDVEASYGCAAFGSGISARFGFARNSKVQTSSLFLSVSATVELDFTQIVDPEIAPFALEFANDEAAFREKYGNMFVRGIKRGGIYVGVLQIDTSSSDEATNISAELEGAYSLFSTEAAVKFSSVQKKYKEEILVRMYHEGGPTELKINDIRNPVELMDNANHFLDSFASRPDQVSVPYLVSLAPIVIARGKSPPNAAEAQHAQDVIVNCAKRRSTYLDQLNLLEYVNSNPSKFDYTKGASKTAIPAAIVDTQKDIDLIARCASAAIRDPKSAMLPAVFAQHELQADPVAEQSGYPRSKLPDPMPIPLAGKTVSVPDFKSCASWYECKKLAAQYGLLLKQVVAAENADKFRVRDIEPSAGLPIEEGGTILLTIQNKKPEPRSFALEAMLKPGYVAPLLGQSLR